MAGFSRLWRSSAAARAQQEALRRVKAWAAERLGPTSEVTLTVNEIACTDPSCPGIETVILVMKPGQKTRAYKIAKAADQITAEDVERALS